ncbi:MAG: SDR family NAD(P)-dependent oxidoreductase [Clostridia bacterium]
MAEKVCLITGGTSGIGKCTALAMKSAGYTVFEISRRQNGIDGIFHISADVTNETEIQKAVQSVVLQAGRIDVLINNAGFGISGAVEFTKTEDAMRQFDVNFFGMVRMVRAVLPIMRKQQSGRILNISSVAAMVPIPFQAYYSAAKAAINNYSMALSNEVRPFGIRICAIQPGDIKTGFTAARQKYCEGDALYNGRISRSVSVMERDEQNGMLPEAAALCILRIAGKKRVRPICTLGMQYRMICAAAKILPAGALNRIVGKIYG